MVTESRKTAKSLGEGLKCMVGPFLLGTVMGEGLSTGGKMMHIWGTVLFEVLLAHPRGESNR